MQVSRHQRYARPYLEDVLKLQHSGAIVYMVGRSQAVQALSRPTKGVIPLGIRLRCRHKRE